MRVNPLARIAASAAPRTTIDTSWPAAASRAAKWPPTAPAPYTAILIGIPMFDLSIFLEYTDCQSTFRHVIDISTMEDARMDGRSRSEELTSELQSLMRISYAVFCLQKKKSPHKQTMIIIQQI